MNNPFKQAEPRVPKSHRSKVRFWRVVFIFIVAGIIGLAATTVFGAARVFAGANNGMNAVEAAMGHAEDFEFQQAKADVVEARESFEQAQSGMVLLRWAHVLPRVGGQAKAGEAVLSAAVETLKAFEEALDVAADVYTVVGRAREELEAADTPEDQMTFEQFSKKHREDLLRVFGRSHGRLKQIFVQLELAREDLKKIKDLNNISPKITRSVEPYEKLLPQAIAAMEVLVPVSGAIDDLAGVNEDRQWLVLFLNNTEMRPAGGFIGAFGLMLMRDGDVINMEVADSYSIDKLVEGNPGYRTTPPAPIRRYLDHDTWFFRDANWSPDFSVSAQDTIQLLRQETAFAGLPAPEVHGVIGFTPTFAENILSVIGPVTVEGITFTGENVTRLLEFEVEFGYEGRGVSFEQRKAVIGQLTERVLEKLFALPVIDWQNMVAIVQNGFQRKYIALYSRDRQSQAVFKDAGWAGVIDPSDADDVLMVVDANMNSLKTDPSVERSIDYTIQKSGGDYIGTTSVTYTHFGVFDLFTSRYRTYTRVFAPAGSELISSSGALLEDKTKNPDLVPGEVTVHEELGMTGFGAFTSVEPGETRTLTFRYRLPESVGAAVESGVYQLKAFKQTGAQNHVLTLGLDFGKKVRAALPAETDEQFGDSAYTISTELDADKLFTIEF